MCGLPLADGGGCLWSWGRSTRAGRPASTSRPLNRECDDILRSWAHFPFTRTSTKQKLRYVDSTAQSSCPDLLSPPCQFSCLTQLSIISLPPAMLLHPVKFSGSSMIAPLDSTKSSSQTAQLSGLTTVLLFALLFLGPISQLGKNGFKLSALGWNDCTYTAKC